MKEIEMMIHLVSWMDLGAFILQKIYIVMIVLEEIENRIIFRIS